ncbi:MAG: M48 family metalloprotease [Blastocatellia bacterium]
MTCTTNHLFQWLNIRFIVLAMLLNASAMTVLATAPGNTKQPALPESAEAANALARFGDLSGPVLRERLKQMRQPAYQPPPLLVQKLIEAQKLPVANNQRVEQVKAALQPVLDYHDRSRMPIYVLWSNEPKAYLVECAVLFITTRLLTISTDEELRGIVAHELAHEYVWA